MGLYTLTILINLSDGFKFWLTGAYGPSRTEDKASFQRELTDLSYLCSEFWLLEGDFNSIQWSQEKSTYCRLTRNMRCFNSFIENVELQDLPLTHGFYTWFDFMENPTLTLIDRFLATNDFLSKFQNAAIKRLNRPTSDHYPIHLSFSLAKWAHPPFDPRMHGYNTILLNL